MSTNVIQPSFTAGELSPALYARVDLAKYHVGLRTAENVLVDFRGGAFNRPGTVFAGRCLSNDDPIFIPFQFSTIQTYVLEFGEKYMRVIMDGGYVLEAKVPITNITQANPGVVTSAAHGFSNGDWLLLSAIFGMVELRKRIVQIGNVTVDNYSLFDLDGNPIDTRDFSPYTSGGFANRIFTLTTPYTESDLPLVKFTQSADVLTLTHINYTTRDLTRTAHDAWTLTEVDVEPDIDPPTGLSGSPFTAGDAIYGYVVTATSRSGQQSIASERLIIDNAADFAAGPGSNTIYWDSVSEVDFYSVYKAVYVPNASADPLNAKIPVGALYGWIGDARGTSFVDNNILPDFSRTPPTKSDPFANGAIVAVEIIAAGAGYDQDTIGYTIHTSTGSGAVLKLVVENGSLTAVIVIDGGSGYKSTDTITFNGQAPGNGASANAAVTPRDVGPTFGGSIGPVTVANGGSGYINPSASVPASPGVQATFFAPVVVGGQITAIYVNNPGTLYDDAAAPIAVTITDTVPGGTGAHASLVLSSANGNNPGAVGYFQQRLALAATLDNPEQMNFSQPGNFHNFDKSNPSRDDDSIQVALASRQVNNIKYLVAMPGGLIVLTGGGAWQVTGGSPNEAITPSSIQAIPQAYSGCADVEPLIINYDILYVQERGNVVRDLSYNFYINIYTGVDISKLSAHLFEGLSIIRWAYAEVPHKAVWAVRNDGKLLSMTYLKEEEIFGWTHHSTFGLYKSVASVQEGNENAVYFIVKRFINGQYVNYAERMVYKNLKYGVEDAWFVDCGLQNALTYPDATLTPSASTGNNVLFTASDNIFSPDDVGKILRVGGGIATVTSYDAPKRIHARITRPIQDVIAVDADAYEMPPADIPLAADSGEWSLTEQVSTVGGLDHLEGQTVSVLADGGVQGQKVVTNGSITLDAPASKITVGLPYSSRWQTLNLDTGDPTIQGKRKKIGAATVRMVETRGIKIGSTFDTLKPIKQRNTQPMGTPIEAFTGDYRIVMDPSWNIEGSVCLQQDFPLPAFITGIIPEIVIGDTPSK